MRIAALLTCYNRKQKTLDSLRGIFNQPVLSELHNVELSVYLVDDNSTDGTAAAVKASYPDVHILPGDGSLFWNGGMRKAFAEAMVQDYDFYLWLNDDTTLYPHALQTLLKTYEDLVQQGKNSAIVVGSTQDPESHELTYGGLVCHRWWHPLSHTLLQPGTEPQLCDVMNGNCVLIPRSVVALVGNLDPAFTHYLGDHDYSHRARQLGCTVWIAPGYVGECSANLSFRSVQASKVDRQVKRMNQPKGLPAGDLTLYPFDEWKTYCQRYGGWFWRFYYFLPYRRLIGLFVRQVFQRSPKIASDQA